MCTVRLTLAVALLAGGTLSCRSSPVVRNCIADLNGLEKAGINTYHEADVEIRAALAMVSAHRTEIFSEERMGFIRNKRGKKGEKRRKKMSNKWHRTKVVCREINARIRDDLSSCSNGMDESDDFWEAMATGFTLTARGYNGRVIDKTRVCYRSVKAERFRFCDLVDLLVHEKAHGFKVQTYDGHGDGDNGDPVWRAGHAARDYCRSLAWNDKWVDHPLGVKWVYPDDWREAQLVSTPWYLPSPNQSVASPNVEADPSSL